MSVIEIATIEGGRLQWVAIYSSTNDQRVIEWGNRLLAGFNRSDQKPAIRVLDKEIHRGGKVIGAWQSEGYEEA